MGALKIQIYTVSEFLNIKKIHININIAYNFLCYKTNNSNLILSLHIYQTHPSLPL